MNPKHPEDFKRLVEAVDQSRRKLEPFRKQRKELVSLFTGDSYGEATEAKKTYLNLLSLATTIYVRQLAVRAPSAKITTAIRSLRPLARNFELACDDVAKESKLGQVLRAAVTSALFSPVSVVKIGLRYAGEEDMDGETVDLTEPFVKLVSFDDYVRDMSARSAYEPEFEGDTYTLTLDEVLSRYPVAKSMNLISGDDINTQNEDGGDRTEALAHERMAGDETLSKKLLVQDIWLPQERKLVTWLVNHSTQPLAVLDLDVEEEGPYRSLWFVDVPDNGMPLPPFSVLRNIFELANSLFRRMANQAESKKNLVGFADEDSAKRFNNAKDGTAIQHDGPKPEPLTAGGIDQANMALFIQVKDMFSWAAGNLDSMGGLSPMAETAKQDALLAQSASAQVADMQDATSMFAESIFRSLAWYEWTDPLRDRHLQKPVPGSDVVLKVKWSPETRQGDFIDFNFTISPQSMREDSPAAKSEKLTVMLQQVILPLLPNLQAQGLGIDARRIVELLSDYNNLPELEQIIITSEGMASPEQIAGDPNPSTKPAHTTRTYERINRPGATRVGKDMALTQALMGKPGQQSELDSIFRNVS